MYINAAEGGHARAQWRLAIAYEDGELDLAIDLVVALMWFKKAAEGGDEDAQWRLAIAYYRRLRYGELYQAIDLDAARTFFQNAAERGHAGAQQHLGVACEFGDLNLAIDLVAALMWFK